MEQTITPAKARSILARISHAYKWSKAAIKEAAEALYHRRAEAYAESYKHCASLTHSQLGDWQPKEAALKQMARESLEQAESIANTFHELVLSQAKQELAKQQTRADDSGDGTDTSGTDDAHAGLKALLLALALFLLAWAGSFLPWKLAQIADYTTSLGQNDGTYQFLEDYGLGYLEFGGDVDPSTVQICVLPPDSSSDFCHGFAGNIYALDDWVLLPRFPAHVGCIHYVMLLVGGMLYDV